LKLIDLTGQKFGKLMVINRAEKPKNNKQGTYWLCRCDCGCEKIINGNNLKNKITLSCGCLAKEKTSERFMKDLSRKRFGKLIVIKRVENSTNIKNKHARWLCKCDCGTEKIINGSSLMKKNGTKSCGCCVSEKMKGINVNRRITPFLRLYKLYKRSATNNNHSFELTENDARILFEGSCYYCGVKPFQKAKLRNNEDEKEMYIYNGIDRVNSSKGYIMGNVVSCCTQCNRGKMQESINDFLNWIKLVHEHQENKNVKIG
jgi:hypothetical protein